MTEEAEECPYGGEHLQESPDQGLEDIADVEETDHGEREEEWNKYLNEKAESGGGGDDEIDNGGFIFTDGIVSKMISAFENTHDIVVSISEFISAQFIGTKSEVIYYGVYLFLMAVVIIVYALIAIAIAIGLFVLELFKK